MSPDEDKEWMRMWQESSMPERIDVRQLARTIAERTEKFDRRIFWRNMREYVAGAGLMFWFFWLARNPGQRWIATGGMVAVGFVMLFLWRKQRKTRTPDPSNDVRSFHGALLARYDTQIALLRRVKYWYVAPLYAWMLLVLFTVPSARGGRLIWFVTFTAFSGFVVWLNESYGVRKLRNARKDAESLLDTVDS